MKNFFLLFSLTLTTGIATFAQQQELSISPIGFALPRNQLLQYERYVDKQQSLTFSLSYNENLRNSLFFNPPRTERFQNVRMAAGYRYYVPGLGIGDELTLFGSVRAIVDYSALRLAYDTRNPVSADSLRAAGFSLAPELLFGAKATFLKRVTLTGSLGGQYLFKLFPTSQITQNQNYWNSFYWTNDNQDAQFKRNVVTHYRQGWYPSIQVTVGVVLGKSR
ncbi:hypothetical protein IC229_13610 [Spirosoma sp. BT702]|uniref:Uncharacterized protein n=1 Tax=Spirosoma profusum TaxID=2771354 RepID=A0A927ATZ8_9BACT|nr:hypothetical protein [Spirosoma profusum]MBD2701682.1 hypothetical protein [Spirosoma profusum]